MRDALLVAAGAIAGTLLTFGIGALAIVAFKRTILDPIAEMGP